MTTSTSTELSVLAEIILVRMALPAKKPPGTAEIRKGLESMIDRRIPDDEFARWCDELVAAELIETIPGKGLRLRETGRARALKFLGKKDFSAGTKWTSIRPTIETGHLLPLALGVSPKEIEAAKDAKQLGALLVRRHYDLPTGLSLSKILEAITCRELAQASRDMSFPQETTLNGLMCSVLSRAVGSERKLTIKELQTQLPLFVTKAKKGGVKELRRAVLKKWAEGGRFSANARAGGPSRPATVPDIRASEFDLPTFAATVGKLARTCPRDGWFGDNKVFISAAWRASQGEPNFPQLTLAQFKSRLVEANTKGLLALSRADLVQVMDPRLVSESETRYLEDTFFHFILVVENRP